MREPDGQNTGHNEDTSSSAGSEGSEGSEGLPEFFIALPWLVHLTAAKSHRGDAQGCSDR